MSQEFPNNKEISPSNNFTNEEINLIRQVFSRKAQISPDLMNKVKEHPFHQKFGSLAFFPKVYELLDAGEEVSMFNLNSPTRKHALKVVSGNESFVIKTLENPNEREIALRAGDLGVGPKQFDTIDGFLTEEWLDGNLIVKLDEAFCTPDRMKSIGKKIKEALLLLHGSDIVVNDQLLTDDFGKSHTIINGEGEVNLLISVPLLMFQNILILMMMSFTALCVLILGYRWNCIIKVKSRYNLQLINSELPFCENIQTRILLRRLIIRFWEKVLIF